MSKVEFISYSGKYPTLCHGILKVKINGKIYELKNVLTSGGSVSFDDDWMEEVTEGDWIVDTWGAYIASAEETSKGNWNINDHWSVFPKELLPYIDEITQVVNENVPHGCCGGCV